jgi:uncharacterized RDD family membrane protein YckC
MPRLASRTNRLLAQLVDYFVAGTIAFYPLLVGAIFALLPSLLFGFLYLITSDGFPNGQTVGKRLLGIATVNATTYLPFSMGQSILRNLLLNFLGWIDWIFIFGQRRQRLGDRAANTIVVDINWLIDRHVQSYSVR